MSEEWEDRTAAAERSMAAIRGEDFGESEARAAEVS
jgi:hypothetical protein